MKSVQLLICLFPLLIAMPAVGAPAKPAPKVPAKAQAAVARKTPAGPAISALSVRPASITLAGAGAEQFLLVSGTTPAGEHRDLSGTAVYRSANPKVAKVTPDGRVRIAGNGATTLEVTAGGRSVRVTVRTTNAGTPPSAGFENDILPLLTRTGCYQAACHAKQGGKNGFQLSVLGFDPEQDYYSVVRQGDGRRTDRQEPSHSLLLLKATAAVPHAGGQRIAAGSPEYEALVRWIAEGAPYRREGEPKLQSVEVEPRELVLGGGQKHRLLVTAVYTDGSRRDVTRMAQYRSNETAIAEVSEQGVVQAFQFPGEAALMARYQGQVAVIRALVPQPQPLPADTFTRQVRLNFIDPLVYRKLEQLRIPPSPLCDDATFLRRTYLDLIGTLPTAAETRAFLAECDAEAIASAPGTASRGEGKGERVATAVTTAASESGSAHPPRIGGRGADSALAPGPAPSPGSSTPGSQYAARPTQHSPKARAKLIDQLLLRPEYSDYWAMRWSNLLLVNPDLLLPRGAYSFDRWLRDAFRKNLPYDQFAREILTSAGDTYREGPPNFFRAVDKPGDVGKAVSQLFLGVRLDCAQCHHHPFERWGQDDFYGLAAFFARVKSKSSYPEGYHSIIYAADNGEIRHPKTDQVLPPRLLGGDVVTVGDDHDRREPLARWITAPENPYFARALVNRMWGMLLGRGLVESVDDFRATNPASNEELLDALAKDFVAHGYDLKHLLKTIAGSAAYQRSSEALPANTRDTRNYARAYTRRMPAEVLLDAVGQVTGVPQTFRGHPEGTRAIQMWDSRLEVEFLEIFGKPGRLSVCECERPVEGSVKQMLHLMNGSSIQERLNKPKGFVTTLEKSTQSEDEVVTELYLTALNRYPRPEELQAARAAFTREKATRRAAIEDLLWVLLNSAEFLLNH